jgi:hypothetical protein
MTWQELDALAASKHDKRGSQSHATARRAAIDVVAAT